MGEARFPRPHHRARGRRRRRCRCGVQRSRGRRSRPGGAGPGACGCARRRGRGRVSDRGGRHHGRRLPGPGRRGVAALHRRIRRLRVPGARTGRDPLPHRGAVPRVPVPDRRAPRRGPLHQPVAHRGVLVVLGRTPGRVVVLLEHRRGEPQPARGDRRGVVVLAEPLSVAAASDRAAARRSRSTRVAARPVVQPEPDAEHPTADLVATGHDRRCDRRWTGARHGTRPWTCGGRRRSRTDRRPPTPGLRRHRRRGWDHRRGPRRSDGGHRAANFVRHRAGSNRHGRGGGNGHPHRGRAPRRSRR